MSSLQFYLQRIYPSVCKLSFVKSKNCNRFCSHFVPINLYNDKDPAPLFFDQNVQKVLKKLTGMNLDKIFTNKIFDHKDKLAQYKFFTDDDLKEHMDVSLRDAKRYLQMPPIVKERKSVTEVISNDPELQGSQLETKIIFTDITFGTSDRKRLIVARDPSGILRHASCEERHRMNQMYQPKPARYLTPPQLFTDENRFNSLLAREEFCFILDLACAHYEPDDTSFQKAVITVYEYVNKRSMQDELHSTRHFGPLCFYLAWNKKIDNLLMSYINKDKLDDAVSLVQLYHLLNPDSVSANSELDEENPLAFIKAYAESSDVSLSANVLMCIQSYEDQKLENQRQEEVIRASQGLD